MWHNADMHFRLAQFQQVRHILDVAQCQQVRHFRYGTVPTGETYFRLAQCQQVKHILDVAQCQQVRHALDVAQC